MCANYGNITEEVKVKVVFREDSVTSFSRYCNHFMYSVYVYFSHSSNNYMSLMIFVCLVIIIYFFYIMLGLFFCILGKTVNIVLMAGPKGNS